MPRYWVCNRCGTYNLEPVCETCELAKEEALAYEEIVDHNPMSYDDEEEIDDSDDFFDSLADQWDDEIEDEW